MVTGRAGYHHMGVPPSASGNSDSQRPAIHRLHPCRLTSREGAGLLTPPGCCCRGLQLAVRPAGPPIKLASTGTLALRLAGVLAALGSAS